VCMRSSLNTNKAPLTYCQLSEVNLSRINFRRKRFRLSARKPSRVKLSSYRSPGAAVVARRVLSLSLFHRLSFSLTHSHTHSISFSLLQIAHAISLSHPLSILFLSHSLYFPSQLYVHTYVRTSSH